MQQDEWAYKLMAKTDFAFHYARINYISSSTSPFAISARKDRRRESNISFPDAYPLCLSIIIDQNLRGTRDLAHQTLKYKYPTGILIEQRSGDAFIIRNETRERESYYYSRPQKYHEHRYNNLFCSCHIWISKNKNDDRDLCDSIRKIEMRNNFLRA